MAVCHGLWLPLSLWWLGIISLAYAEVQTVEVSQIGAVQADTGALLINADSDYWQEKHLDEETERGSDFGVAQNLGSAEERSQVLARLEETRRYFETQVNVNETLALVRDICRNQHEQCTFWATVGECENNPTYMQQKCAPACLSCDQAHVSLRCRPDSNAPDSVYPGGIDEIFERILQDPALQIYDPKVLSRPYYAAGDTAENANYQIGLWLVTLDNLLSKDESNRMIELGYSLGYEPSEDIIVDEPLEDGTFRMETIPGRSSTNSWCTGACYNDTVTQRIAGLMEHITGLPEENTEYYQLVKYEPGESYRIHSDYKGYMRDRPFGARVLTFFIYLNDQGVKGGETNFPHMGIKVPPKAGSALLWPSVFNDDPHSPDVRAEHEAMVVQKGVKYAVNTWYHQRSAKSDLSMRCLL